MQKRPSNPVAPTTVYMGKLKTKNEGPVAQLAAPSSNVAEVLQKLQQAFLDAAAALGAYSGSTSTFQPVVLPQFHTKSQTGGLMPTLVELTNDFLRSKARANRSDRYLRQLRVSLANFARGRGNEVINEITADDVERWLHVSQFAPKTASGYLGDVRGLFTYAVNRGYITLNPAKAVENPVQTDGFEEIGIHTPEQVRKVLETCRKNNLNVCRMMAIRYFAGVRSSEALRLREENVKLDQGYIEVPASKSKTRSRRLVAIHPNLRAWLEIGGELVPMSADRTIRATIRLAKVEWPNNVTRHSFVSYHVAHFGNAGKTALEAGNSEAMVFRHYRALATAKEAADFWAIVPK